MLKKIVVKGAKEHNLKNVSLEIPKEKLVVITGLSGSGKSSLAFDTIYAEGQRRYVESLSSYARQFLDKMKKPKVDLIEGLSPAISIEQKNTSKNPRSTVATVTEIYDYMRVLFARVGIPYSPFTGKPIVSQPISEEDKEKISSLVKEAMEVETWDDVVDVCKKLYDFIEDQKEDEKEEDEMEMGMPSSDSGEAPENEGEIPMSGDEESDDSEEGNGDADGESDEDSSTSAVDQEGGDDDGHETWTEDTQREREEDLLEKSPEKQRGRSPTNRTGKDRDKTKSPPAPRKRRKSPSGEADRPPCFRYLKGQCTDAECKYWHPPACRDFQPLTPLQII